jgi:hypothetical protein
VPLSHPFVERLSVRFGANTSTGFYSGPPQIWRRSYSISNITITVVERMPGWRGARRNRALTQVAHLQVSGHIDGSSIVADSIKANSGMNLCSG